VISLRLLRTCTAWVGGLVISAAALAGTEMGQPWASLSPSQQQALAPLQRDWSGLNANRKQKWLMVAARFPSLPPAERTRVQQRMTEWARLSQPERDKARLGFTETRKVTPEERQAKWQAYQALPEAERQSLAAKSQPHGKPALPMANRSSAINAGNPGQVAPAPVAVMTKRNLVQAPPTDRVKPVAPLVVQANPGATTSNISARPQRPSHNQAGLPKIAATPGYVDAATLLPKRGAQGAAALSAADNVGPN
jgi:hypothetical protein